MRRRRGDAQISCVRAVDGPPYHTMIERPVTCKQEVLRGKVLRVKEEGYKTVRSLSFILKS